MTTHRTAVETHVVEHWCYRGSCTECGWRGPWRPTQDQSQADAWQHLADVKLYPDPVAPHG